MWGTTAVSEVYVCACLSISHIRSGNFSWRMTLFVSVVCKRQSYCVGAFIDHSVVLKASAASEKFMGKKFRGKRIQLMQ